LIDLRSAICDLRSAICDLLMEMQSPVLFDLWFERWNDFVEFDLVPIDE
jgi:hypothetical protein